jgi:dTMP kinase
MAFVVFEGLDGSGKSTLIKKLEQLLLQKGKAVELTREPGGTPLAEDIRHLLLRTEGEPPAPLTELLLYEAARSQHVQTKIQPALKRGAWVLCDRYTGSTLAFQCGGRGIDRKLVDTLNSIATQNLEPDLWVLLDLSLEESMRRRENRDQSGEKALDRFELEAQQFHKKVRNYYLQLAKEQPQKWLVLNAESSPEDVFSEMKLRLEQGGWLL